jgi:hypothetical protein
LWVAHVGGEVKALAIDLGEGRDFFSNPQLTQVGILHSECCSRSQAHGSPGMGTAYALSPALLTFAAVSVLGFIGAAWTWLLGVALAGLIGYWVKRPVAFSRMHEASDLRGSIVRITTYVAAVYFSQLAVCSALFLTGRVLGFLLGT